MLQAKSLNLIIIVLAISLNSCSKLRESAGVTRQSLDEFKVVENPPLVIPPDFNLVAPDKLQQKNIDDVENELAKEILFGLDDKEQSKDKQLSTMNQILFQSNAINISDEIRNEIDQEFVKEIKTDGIFQINWENELEVLDAVKESERIRNKNFDEQSIVDDKIPIKKIKVKIKKKKRFIFF